MRTVNQVTLIGNIVKDPTIKEVSNGQTLAMFTIATNRNWISKTGEKQSSTEFHNCVAWAQVADLVNKHVRKGKLVYATGYLKTREYLDEVSNKKSFRTEIVVLDLILLDKRPKSVSDGETEEYDLEHPVSSDIAIDGVDI